MKGMRDSKEPISSSALNKMMKKFEATGSLASRQNGRPSTSVAVAMTVEQTVQFMSVAAAHGEYSAREVSRQTGVSYGSVWRSQRGGGHKTVFVTGQRYVALFHNNIIPEFQAQSSDLIPCDLWQYGILKSKEYRDQPASLAALKDATHQNVSAITQEILLNAVNGVVTRLTAVLLNDEQHMEHLLQY
ncbi:transposable element tc3 transposase [Trichonephila clavipes]|nr:transposable element tc3 transposase [Trichonephila clavipes]